MKTVQMTLDEDLIKSIDKAARQLHTTRSAFARQALREALKKFVLKRMEVQHKKGYQNQPVSKDEFSLWESEQVWGDE